MTVAAGQAREPRQWERGALADAPGPVLEIISGAQDLAARPADDAAQGDERYRDLLGGLGVAVYTTDDAGRITFFNDAAALLWGRHPEIGEEWCGSWRLYWPDGAPMRHEECPMAIALAENRPVRGAEAVAERPDGTRVSFVPYPTPLRDADGALVGGINVLVDVTERKQAEEALRATAEALRASNAVKDEFLGLVSHELRTPLTTIVGNARLLLNTGDRLAAADKQSMLADIAHDSERLLGLIENLLLLTRLESGPHPDAEPQVLAHIVRKATESFTRRHQGRSVTFRAETRDGIVEADATYLELLMENLLTNADKYSAAGTEVEVVVRTDGNEAQVVVLDRGIGIGDDDAATVFTPFFRTAAAKSRAEGMGIGLAVCRRVAETHGGHMWARPRPGGGSEFGFALPRA